MPGQISSVRCQSNKQLDFILSMLSSLEGIPHFRLVIVVNSVGTLDLKAVPEGLIVRDNNQDDVDIETAKDDEEQSEEDELDVFPSFNEDDQHTEEGKQDLENTPEDPGKAEEPVVLRKGV